MSPTLPSFDFAATRGKRSRMASFAPVLPEGLSHLPNMRFLIPRQVRRRWRATKGRLRVGQSPASNVFRLQTSWSPTDTIAALRTHQWSLYDFQYLGLAILGIFCLSIMENPGPMVKTFGATALLLSLVFPVTSQFWLPTLPVVGWIILFFSCRFIDGAYRPSIHVRVLPALENIFYGANLSNILSSHKNSFLDVLAWLPYGITHFGAPVVVSIIMFIWGPPGIVPTFSRAFGYMNIAGVLIQLLFPCSPPWYENLYGLVPANYSIPGSPAGLAAVDKLFGVDMYTTAFTGSPQVFGAFPSLHSANATVEALFMSFVFPKLAPLFIAYTLWLWWATMYLSHHYAVDLVGGSLLAGIAFYIAKAKFLPRMQPEKEFRWDYDYVEIGESQDNYSAKDGTGFYEEFQTGVSDDEWTVGSSSSISSRSRSPSNTNRSSSETSLWEGETLASTSDTEQRSR